VYIKKTLEQAEENKKRKSALNGFIAIIIVLYSFP
jgi:hypothetical protein